jgi:hypothetical protein
MLLNLRSLAEVAEGEHVGAGASTGAPATSAGTGVVVPAQPPTPVFVGGTSPRHRPEPIHIVGVGHAVAAMAIVHAVGSVRPPLTNDVAALSLLGFEPWEIADLLGLERLPAEAEAIALALAPTRLRR